MPRALSNADLAILQNHLTTAQTAHAQNPGPDNATRDAAREAYYQQLADWGYQYGELARGVVTNDLASGRTANNFFQRVAGKEGVELTDAEIIDLSLALMQADFDARNDGDSVARDGEPLNVNTIERYHVEVFNSFDVSGEAWTPFFLLNNSSLTGQDLVDYRNNLWEDLLESGDNLVSSILTAALALAAIDAGATLDRGLREAVQKYYSNVTVAGCYAATGTPSVFNSAPIICIGVEAAVNRTHQQDNIQRLDFTPEPSAPIDGALGREFGFGQTLADPLIFDLDGHGIQLLSVTDADVQFDIDADGFAEAIGYHGDRDDGILVIDAGNDGIIASIDEIVGSQTETGFDVLRSADFNSDNVINASDAIFSDLRLWIDANGNGVSDPGELHTLAELGIEEIDLDDAVIGNIVEGNVLASQSSAETASGEVDVFSVFFDSDQVISEFILPEGFEYSPKIARLPNLAGRGDVPDLLFAAQNDAALAGLLQDLVDDYSTLTANDFLIRVETIINQWIGEGPSTGRGNVDHQKLFVLESYFGTPFFSQTVVGLQDNFIEDAYDVIFNDLAAKLLVQLPQANIESLIANGTIDGRADLVTDALSAVMYDFDNNQLLASPDALAIFIGAASTGEAGSVLTGLDQAGRFLNILSDALPSVGGLSFRERTIASIEELSDLFSDSALGPAAILAALNSSSTIVIGTDGNDTLIAGGDAEFVTADNVIFGGLGDDILNGDRGGLSSPTGNDTYIYFLGDGNDIIEDNSRGNTTDQLLLQGLTLDDVVLSRGGQNGVDLLISFSDGAVVQVVNQFASETFDRLELFVFEGDGFSLTDSTLRELLIDQSTSDADDTVAGFAGVSDTLEGGLGNDTLEGRTGGDIYIYTLGDGNDVIEDNGNDQLADRLIIRGVSLADVTFARGSNNTSNANNVIIQFADGGSITLRDQLGFGTTVGSALRIEQIIFEDTGEEIDTSPANLIDLIFADAATDGDDDILGFEGFDDIIRGGAGNDVIDGANGNDQLFGDDGDDELIGDDGADLLDGGDGNDFIRGNDGNDSLIGGTGHDILFADNGNDTVDGGDGNDELGGGAGNDVLIGGNGDDDLRGGDGDDVLRGGAGVDSLDGGNGSDTVDFSGALNGQMITLNADGGATVGLDTLISIENLIGSNVGGDALTGNTGANTLDGRGGDDVILGGSGTDTILGGNGDDTLNGQGGNDILFGGNGADEIRGGGLNDVLHGDDGDDRLFGDQGVDVIHGGDGNDLLSGGTEADTLFGDAGDDTLVGGLSVDTLHGGTGNDILRGEGANDVLFGDEGDDQLLGGDLADQLFGGDGADRLNGEGGFDQLTGGSGADTFIFSGAAFDNDRITDFEDGVDRILFRSSTGVASFDDLTINDVAGPDVVIVTAAGNVRLENTNIADIDVTDFVFA